MYVSHQTDRLTHNALKKFTIQLFYFCQTYNAKSPLNKLFLSTLYSTQYVVHSTQYTVQRFKDNITINTVDSVPQVKM